MAYSSLRQAATERRGNYEADEAAGLESLYAQNPALSAMGGGQAGAINQMRIRHGNERGQANFAPQWDAYFEAASGPEGQAPVFGGGSGSLSGLRESATGLTAQTPDLGTVRGHGTQPQLNAALRAMRQQAGRRR